MPKTQKTPKKPHRERCYLQEAETNVLRELQREWIKLPDKRCRDSFVNATVLPKIQELNKEKFSPEKISRCKDTKKLWEIRVKAIFGWFKNHKPYKEKAVFKVERKLTLRWVVGRVRAAEIDRLIRATHPDLEKGHKTYPGLYQKCLTTYMNGLDPEDRRVLEGEMEKWQKDGPPMELRTKAAKKYSRKAIANMHTTLHKEMDLHCLTFEFHRDDDGRMMLICHDYVNALCALDGGDKFLPFHLFDPKGYTLVMNTMLEYTHYVRQKLDKKGDTVEEPAKGTFQSDLILKGPGGLPLLPKPCLGVKGHEVAELLKDIVREYFTTHYRLATGKTSARPPWKAIGENPTQFFDLVCIPEGFVFQDPSRMGQSVKVLIDHLRKREDEFGVNAFKFNQIQVCGVPDLQSAQYPPEAQEVIAAGSAVKNWPRAADIMIGQSLVRIDENPETSIDNDVDMACESRTEEPTIQVTDVLMTPPETAMIDPPLIQQDTYAGTSNKNGDSIGEVAVDMHAVPSQEPMARPSVIPEDTLTMVPEFMGDPLSKTLKDCPNNPPEPNKLARDEKTPSAVPQFNFNSPGVGHSIPMQFPQHQGGMPYYFPTSQDMRSHPGMPHMVNNMGHPFMAHMGQEQWGIPMQYAFYSGQNPAVSSIPDGPPTAISDPTKLMIDPALPSGPPPFSMPYPQQLQEYFLRPPMVSQFQGNPFLVGGSSVPAFASPAIGAPSSSGIPMMNIPSTAMDGAKLIPPKGTPSPKKTSPKKRGRAQTGDEAEVKTPSRNRKRIT